MGEQIHPSHSGGSFSNNSPWQWRANLNGMEHAVADWLNWREPLKALLKRVDDSQQGSSPIGLYRVLNMAADPDPQVQWRYEIEYVAGFSFGTPLSSVRSARNVLKPFEVSPFVVGDIVEVHMFPDVTGPQGAQIPCINEPEQAVPGECSQGAKRAFASATNALGAASEIGTLAQTLDYLIANVTAITNASYGFGDLGFSYDWDAASLTSSLADGAQVASWTDRISGAALAQSTAGDRPIFRAMQAFGPTINFVSNDLLTLSSGITIEDNFCIILIAATNAATDDVDFVGGFAADEARVRVNYAGSAGILNMYDGVTDTPSTVAMGWSTTRMNVMTFACTGGTLTMYGNGWNLGGGTQGDSMAIGRVGMNFSGARAANNSHMKRLLIKTSAISNADLQIAWTRLHSTLRGTNGP